MPLGSVEVEENEEGRLMLATLFPKPNKVPQEISSLLM